MVGKVIRDYMEGGAKKLTVPGFGTFMRRDGGEVIFVDLLRGDDHTLSEMVEDRGGHSEVEAMALIDRFIFETKTAIERHGSALIEGFGAMTLNHKGVYQFCYAPKARPVKETAVQERLFEKEPPRPAVKTTAEPPVPHTHESAPAQRPGRPPAVKPDPRLRPQRPQTKSRPSRMDTVLIVAIAAAILAIIAMFFAISAGNMPFLHR